MGAALWFGEIVGGKAQRHDALLRFCAEITGVALERLTLAHNFFSAPLLLLDGEETGWRISSASRGDIALFGLAREKIGVDVELASSAEPAWNVLHEQEKAALRALPEELRPEKFLRLWTAKEAYLKALGLGLRREPSEICILAQAGQFEVIDQGRKIATREARLWREKAGESQALCASVVLPALL
ncbi:4'-phosphopantetheinyl transferase family protein [Rhodoblastus sp.]|uniref:4'-phosphopantetheinyl transferase family protein n=1 Tax=Rhodoblastus sp. TaxID=1962975 RepID=UPI003F9D9865